MESMKSEDISNKLLINDIKISTVSELRKSFEAAFNILGEF